MHWYTILVQLLTSIDSYSEGRKNQNCMDFGYNHVKHDWSLVCLCTLHLPIKPNLIVLSSIDSMPCFHYLFLPLPQVFLLEFFNSEIYYLFCNTQSSPALTNQATWILNSSNLATLKSLHLDRPVWTEFNSQVNLSLLF